MLTPKNLPRATLLSSIAVSFLLTSALANAHARLEGTTPAADSSVSSPKLIKAHFSEAIETKLSSLKLFSKAGWVIPVMSMNDAKDPATLSIMPNAPLKPGSYTVTWSVVSDDGHKTHGTFRFTVQ